MFREPTASSLGFIRFENLEIRQLMSGTVRSIDGTGNNLAHPLWGAPIKRWFDWPPPSTPTENPAGRVDSRPVGGRERSATR